MRYLANRKRSLITGVLVFMVLGFFTACEDAILSAIEEEIQLMQLADLSLTVLESQIGTVTPEGVIRIKDGDSVDLTAVPPIDFDFVRWEKVSGDGTTLFDDASSTNTAVTLSGGDATIRAVWDDVVDPTGSIAIEDKILVSGIYYRNSRTVDVTLTYDDNSGSVPRMKLSSFSFPKGTTTGWESASASTTFAFTSDGDQTLYVRFQDESGNESNQYSTDVYIDSTPPIATLTEIVHSADPTDYREYVTGVSDSVISLVYAANDSGAGIEKVYFSNSTSRPALPQINPYTEPHAPYPWELTIYIQNYKDYSVYFWFEDKLGNISATPYVDTVRYDDYYEGPDGNNSIDAVSGATLIMDNSSVWEDRLIVFGGEGAARLLDADYYKFGFDFSDFEASIKLDLNTIGPNPRVTFFDHNRDVITPTAIFDPPDYFDVQYNFTFPYINTYGYPYYIYVRVDRSTGTIPYTTSLSYDLAWDFNYIGM